MVFLEANVMFGFYNRLNSRRLAPRARFELATLRLTAECSTIELPGSRTDFLSPIVANSPRCCSSAVTITEHHTAHRHRTGLQCLSLVNSSPPPDQGSLLGSF